MTSKTSTPHRWLLLRLLHNVSKTKAILLQESHRESESTTNLLEESHSDSGSHSLHMYSVIKVLCSHNSVMQLCGESDDINDNAFKHFNPVPLRLAASLLGNCLLVRECEDLVMNVAESNGVFDL